MRAIVLDKNAWQKLRKQHHSRKAKENVPVDWHGFVDELSLAGAGEPAARFGWRDLIFSGKSLFSWQMSSETIFAALRGHRQGGGLVYLCWGIPARSGWKSHIAAFVLRRAEYVLVNDAVTGKEVENFCNRKADIVPFFIDSHFFVFKPLEDRQGFLFCPGSNDRDPEILVGLAERGHKLVWLVNDKGLQREYENCHKNLRLVSHISYEELRSHYQSCAAVVLPALRDAHAAGQTTAMEAISCGAPVLMSEGRTATIFAHKASVYIMTSKDIDEWSNKLINVLDNVELAQQTRKASIDIGQRLTIESMRCEFAPFFQLASADRPVRSVKNNQEQQARHKK